MSEFRICTLVVAILLLLSCNTLSVAASVTSVEGVNNPQNISPVLYEFYLGNLEQGVEEVYIESSENVVALNDLTCALTVTRELTSLEQEELKSMGITFKHFSPYEEYPMYIVELPITIIPYLANYSFVKYVESIMGTPILELEVSTRQIRANDVWSRGFDGSGITVVVIDSSGVDANNPFIKDRIVNQYDYNRFLPDDNIAEPEGSQPNHGTHCVGIIAASPIIVDTVSTTVETAITPGSSQSGIYHLGVLSENVDADHQYDLNDDGDTIDSFSVLVADTISSGVYDQVYIDTNGDGDWVDALDASGKAYDWLNMRHSDTNSPYSYYPISNIAADGNSFEFGLKGVAPGADIIVIKPYSEETIIEAIEKAVDDYDADVISMSLGIWTIEKRFDGSDPIARAVDYAYNEGALFIKSSGNYGNDDAHVSGSVQNSEHIDFDLNLNGGSGWVHLTWTNNDGEANNLDLHVYDSAGAVLVDSSTNLAGSDESVNGLADGTYVVRVTGTNVEGGSFQQFHLYVMRDTSTIDNDFVPSDPEYTLSVPGDALHSFTTGAVTKAIIGCAVTGYSSRGPTTDNRNQPRVVAPGGDYGTNDMSPPYSEIVSTAVDDGDNCDTSPPIRTDPNDYYGRMCGTSMSAPHVAGAAALILQAVQALDEKPNMLATALESSAEDMGPAGWDRESGCGLINVDDAIVRANIIAGLEYLRTTQQGTQDPSDGDGSWSSDVGVTSLAALSFMNDGYNETDPDVRDAIGYIRSKVKADGSIWSGSKTYHTSLATLALVATHNDSYDATIDNAAQWLKNSQWDEDCLWGTVNEDHWYYGGFGYGSHTRPDNSNTQFALMALDAVQSIPKDDPLWDKAQIFLNRTQARDESNDQTWANGRNSGGFIYTPDGGTAGVGSINGYGSMTGAGIWGMRLSNVKKDDPRIEAAVGWVTNNYMWDGNPGTSNTGNGQYYYYLSMSKALTMINDSVGGKDWYQDLSNNLTALQKPEGYWVNDRSSWAWENNKDLVTSYAILSLQTRADIPEDIKRLSYLTFILHSYADLHIYDPLGRHVGMNYSTGEIEIQIPGATYMSNGEQNITVPHLEAGNYRIVLVGTGTGEYTLNVTGGVGDTIVCEKSFTSTISEGVVHEANVNVAMITWLTIHIEGPEPEETHATIKKDFRYTTNVNFTQAPANLGDLLLDPNDNGKYNVTYVLKKKNYNVVSTNPGQLYGVINITGAGVTNISINDTFGSQFDVNPEKLGGGVEVIRLNSTSGNATVLTDTANVSSAEVNNEINRVKLIINLTEPLRPNEHLMIYVKFKTALKHKIPDYSDFINQAKVYVDNEGLLAAQATIEFE